MTKQSFRSFGFGLLAAAAALFFADAANQPDKSTTSEMIDVLEKKNYIVQPAESVQSGKNTDEKRVEEKKEETASILTISIKPGMSSADVANELKKAGLIKDAVSYNNYLTDNGYADKLRAGTFTFKQGASFKELTSMLVQ